MFRPTKNGKPSTKNRLKSHRKRRKKKRKLFQRRKNNFPQIPYGMSNIVIQTSHHNESAYDCNNNIKAQYIQQKLGSKYEYMDYIDRSFTSHKIVKAKHTSQPTQNTEKEFYSIKIVEHIFTSKAKTQRILRELRILRLLQPHENIVELIDLVPVTNPLKFTRLPVVFEFMSSNLKKVFRSKQY
eukprot:350752_1